MELIKQIRDAEGKAKKLLADAERDALLSFDNVKKQQVSKLEAATRQRAEAIERAITSGRNAGQQQANELKTSSARQQQQIKDSFTKQADLAVKQIIEFLQNN